MKRSIVEVNLPQHSRDSSLSSLESVFSNFSETEVREASETTAFYDVHEHLSALDYEEYISYEDYYLNNNIFTTMQEEYDNSTKQPTPGRPKMARVIATSSPEISALCRKSYPPPSSLQSPSFEYGTDFEQQEMRAINNVPRHPFSRNHRHQQDTYSLSSDSSNFSMSSSSMESLSYAPVNQASSASISTWEDRPKKLASRKVPGNVRLRSNSTVPTAASTTGTHASFATSASYGTAERQVYVRVGSPSNENRCQLNYSGTDLDLEAVTSSLNTIQIYQPEPRRRDSTSSFCSAAPTHLSCASGSVRRPSLHRRLSYDSLPTPEMIMYESAPLGLPPPPPPPLPFERSASERISPNVSFPSSPIPQHHPSPRGGHRRNTSQIIMPPTKPLVS